MTQHGQNIDDMNEDELRAQVRHLTSILNTPLYAQAEIDAMPQVTLRNRNGNTHRREDHPRNRRTRTARTGTIRPSHRIAE